MKSESKRRRMTTDQAAHYLAVTTFVIRSAVRRGELPFMKVGGRNVFDRLDLRRWAGNKLRRTYF